MQIRLRIHRHIWEIEVVTLSNVGSKPRLGSVAQPSTASPQNTTQIPPPLNPSVEYYLDVQGVFREGRIWVFIMVKEHSLSAGCTPNSCRFSFSEASVTKYHQPKTALKRHVQYYAKLLGKLCRFRGPIKGPA